MRILMVTPRCGETAGGDGLYAYHLANACSAMQVDTHVLTVRGRRFVHIEWSRHSGSDREEAEQFVHDLGQVAQDFFRYNYYSRTAGRSIASIIERVRPDLIHVHGLHQVFTLAAISRLKAFSGPIVLTVHDYKLLCGNASFFSDRTESPCFLCLNGEYLPPLRERCKKGSFISSLGASVQMGLWKQMRGLDGIDVFHCGSEYVRNLLSQNSSIRDRLAKIRFPVLHHSEPALDRDTNEFRELAYVGRMVPHKGPIVFAQAVQGLRVPIKIYGDGRLMSSMGSLLRSNQQVHFRGWVSHQTMDQELGPGSIVVVPYLANETFCYVVLEAMVRGCCVVASARGAIPELIEDGLNGVLVQTPSAGEFRKAIDGLLRDQDLILKIGQRAKSIVNEIPSLTDHANKILSLYTKAIGERNPVLA